MGKIVRVLRLVQYVGDEEAVKRTVERSIHGTREVGSSADRIRITAITIGEFPETLEEKL